MLKLFNKQSGEVGPAPAGSKTDWIGAVPALAAAVKYGKTKTDLIPAIPLVIKLLKVPPAATF